MEGIVARTPDLPELKADTPSPQKPAAEVRRFLWEARAGDIAGLGDRSAFGLPGENTAFEEFQSTPAPLPPPSD